MTSRKVTTEAHEEAGECDQLLSSQQESRSQERSGAKPLDGAEELIQTQVEAEIQRFDREHCFRPRANIYRCWAIGLCSGTRLVAMTCCAILVQTLGPVMVMDYSRRKLNHYDQGLTLDYFQSQYKARHDSEKDMHLLPWLFYNSTARKQIEIKVLGSLLLALVFMSTDRQLLEQEMETNNLRRFFQIRSCSSWLWLWADAICNGIAYVTIALCLGTFLSYEDTVPDLLLDAIGLYFMSNVDNIGLDIRYGVPIERYDALVEKAQAIWAKAHIKEEISKERDQEYVTACGPLPLHHKPTLVLSYARLINCFIYSLELPIFMLYIPTGVYTETLPGNHDRNVALDSWHVWWPYSICILLLILLSNCFSYCRLRRKVKENNGTISCEFFTSHFIFRRPYTTDQSLEAAHAIVRREEERQKIHDIEAELQRFSSGSSSASKMLGVSQESGGKTTFKERLCDPSRLDWLSR